MDGLFFEASCTTTVATPGGRISGDLTVDLSKISHDNLEAGRDLIIEFKSSDSVFVTTELDLEEN